MDFLCFVDDFYSNALEAICLLGDFGDSGY